MNGFHTDPRFSIKSFSMANLDQYAPYVDAVGNAAMNFAMADLSYKKNKKLLKQQYQYQKEAAELAWQRQMQFYEDQKAYNDPNAVRQRYEAAGLNVNAAFGTAGSYSPTNAPSSVQPAGGVSTPYVDYTNMKFQSALGLARQQAEIDLIKAQADETRGRTLDQGETQRGQKLGNDLTALNARLTDANIIGKGLANRLDSLDLRFRNEVYDTSVTIERQKALNIAKQYEVMNEDIARSVAGRSLTEDQRNEIRSRIWLNARNSALAQIQAEYHGKLSQAQIDELVAKTNSLESTKNWLDERAKTEKASRRLTDAKAELSLIDLHDLRNIPEKTRQITRSMKMIKDGLIY